MNIPTRLPLLALALTFATACGPRQVEVRGAAGVPPSGGNSGLIAVLLNG